MQSKHSPAVPQAAKLLGAPANQRLPHRYRIVEPQHSAFVKLEDIWSTQWELGWGVVGNRDRTVYYVQGTGIVQKCHDSRGGGQRPESNGAEGISQACSELLEEYPG